MTRIRTYMKAAIMLIAAMLGFAPRSSAQVYVSVGVPTEYCAGAVDTLTFGFGESNTIVIDASMASQSHPGTVFLPDGVPCGEYGCSYRSPVTFSDFSPNATISSIEDIRYVRLNIEHSYFKDLYINITCPNGSKTTLMRFGGKNTSSCSEAIPQNAEGWLDGNNLSGHQSFGIAYDDENTDDHCNPNAQGNAPGTGWNYCWSRNTTEGYTYASGDGIIYRDGHATAGRIDSSNVAAGTNFYHPDGSMTNLVGCPLNGNWYIEVVDGYRQDNGYIFDWELALDPSLLPDSCSLTRRIIEGPYVERVNDSVYLFLPPADLAADTVVELTLRMLNSCGDTIDSVISVTLHATVYGVDSIESVGGYSIGGKIYTNDTTVIQTLVAANGCDSVVTLVLKVWHDVNVEYDTIVCDPQYPLSWRGYSFLGPGVAHLNLTSVHGADSNVTLVVVEGASKDTVVVTAICQGQSYWLGQTPVSDSGQYDTVLATILGCDSSVHLGLTVYPIYFDEAWDTVCATEGYWYQGQPINQPGDYSQHYATIHGCDSTQLLHLEVVGQGLRAIAHVSPSIVKPDDLRVVFTDASLGSEGRLWTLGDSVVLMQSAVRRFDFDYPEEYDSIPVELVAVGGEGCTDTQRLVLHIDRSALAVPNAFTPDMEENNHWHIATRDVKTLQVWIYNRLGQLVVHLDEATAEWDGTTKDGHPCPTGAYVFYASYTTVTHPDRTQSLNGTILLIR